MRTFRGDNSWNKVRMDSGRASIRQGRNDAGGRWTLLGTLREGRFPGGRAADFAEMVKLSLSNVHAYEYVDGIVHVRSQSLWSLVTLAHYVCVSSGHQCFFSS